MTKINITARLDLKVKLNVAFLVKQSFLILKILAFFMYALWKSLEPLQTNCGIAQILGILMMNSYDF